MNLPQVQRGFRHLLYQPVQDSWLNPQWLNPWLQTPPVRANTFNPALPTANTRVPASPAKPHPHTHPEPPSSPERGPPTPSSSQPVAKRRATFVKTQFKSPNYFRLFVCLFVANSTWSCQASGLTAPQSSFLPAPVRYWDKSRTR